MNDLLWRVTQGGAGMVKPDDNEDLNQVIKPTNEQSVEDLTKMMSPQINKIDILDVNVTPKDRRSRRQSQE